MNNHTSGPYGYGSDNNNSGGSQNLCKLFPIHNSVSVIRISPLLLIKISSVVKSIKSNLQELLYI